jgi:hypothetical protein
LGKVRGGKDENERGNSDFDDKREGFQGEREREREMEKKGKMKGDGKEKRNERVSGKCFCGSE